LVASWTSWHLSEQLPGRLDVSVEEHDQIIQATADRDPTAAARTMRAHILSVRAQQLAVADDELWATPHLPPQGVNQRRP
jgi:DNA-binding GntR family transcriptional regulator